jgi:hypothetical protein
MCGDTTLQRLHHVRKRVHVKDLELLYEHGSLWGSVQRQPLVYNDLHPPSNYTAVSVTLVVPLDTGPPFPPPSLPWTLL